MFPGVFALFERSLRLDARALTPHLTRGALMITVYVAICITTLTSIWFGAPGLLFFRNIIFLNLVFMTLMGIGYFSTTITEEKEEDTLGLMLMAGISPLGILLGKSLGRMIQALLIIAIQYPFTLLAVTMGGVTQHQVSAGYMSLVAYMLFLAGAGLLCSTVAPRNRSASFWMTILVAVYFAIPSYCNWLLIGTASRTYLWTLLSWIGEFSVFNQMRSIMTSVTDDPIISSQVISNVLAGVVCFVTSWILFGYAVRTPTSEAAPRGMLTRNRRSIRIFSPGRSMVDPLVWKDFHFIAGGVAGLITRLAFFVLLLLAVVLLVGIDFLSLRWGPPSWYGVAGTYLTLMMFAVSFDAGLLMSRSLHEEVRGQTLATLMMLPKSTGMILYPKLGGTLLGWLPGPIMMILAILLLPQGFRCAGDFFHRPGPPFLFLSFFALVPNVAALTAMYVRWGALPVAIGITIGLAFLTGLFINLLRIGPGDTSVFVIATGIIGLCFVCHIAIWLRAEALSGRS